MVITSIIKLELIENNIVIELILQGNNTLYPCENHTIKTLLSKHVFTKQNIIKFLFLLVYKNK